MTENKSGRCSGSSSGILRPAPNRSRMTLAYWGAVRRANAGSEGLKGGGGVPSPLTVPPPGTVVEPPPGTAVPSSVVGGSPILPVQAPTNAINPAQAAARPRGRANPDEVVAFAICVEVARTDITRQKSTMENQNRDMDHTLDVG